MKIAVLSSHTSSLFWFRVDLMKEFKELGHEVVAIGSESEQEWSGRFKRLGINYRYLPVARTGINPFVDGTTLIKLYKLLMEEKPDAIFAYHPKTIIFGSIAGRLNGIREVHLLFSGLGSIFRGKGIKNVILRWIMKVHYKLACKISKKVMFQNPDDLNVFVESGIVTPEKCTVINGSGVNTKHFSEAELPETTGFLYVGRLIRDKGVKEYLDACRIVKKENPNVRCMLVGPFDTNPTALSPEEIQDFLDDGTIEYFGEQEDVRPFIRKCSVYVLPSYHEGTPKSVLEAMAMGRPVITTNTVGCKETVVQGNNGFLVEVMNSSAVAEKMRWFIDNPEFIRPMGQESLKLCRRKYDVRIVNAQILKCMGMMPLFISTNKIDYVSGKGVAINGESGQRRSRIYDYEYLQENQPKEDSV